MTEINLKFPLFYLANKEILKKMEQENSKYLCYFEFSHSTLDFLVRKIKEGISKIFLSFFTLFLYIPWFYVHTQNSTICIQSVMIWIFYIFIQVYCYHSVHIMHSYLHMYNLQNLCLSPNWKTF